MGMALRDVIANVFYDDKITVALKGSNKATDDPSRDADGSIDLGLTRFLPFEDSDRILRGKGANAL